MASALPGSDKYRRPRVDTDAPWNDALVLKANAEVGIVDVLNGWFKTHIPIDAEGWKTRCPFAGEHEDGGVDRQFRVYTSTNSGHCFALHGTLDPVRLWRTKHPSLSLRGAAEDLLDTFGVEHRRKPYYERMMALLEQRDFVAEPAPVVQALNVWLEAQPGYQIRQYQENVLRTVNSVLSEVHGMCAEATSLSDVSAWFEKAKARVARELQ